LDAVNVSKVTVKTCKKIQKKSIYNKCCSFGLSIHQKNCFLILKTYFDFHNCFSIKFNSHLFV